MANHYRKTRKLYNKRRNDAVCPFCDQKTTTDIVYQNSLAFVIPNLTKYDVWELHDVHEHVMVIPKRHIETLADATDEEKLALMNIIADYESKGYSAYARGVGFTRRSVKHQHTHLIKADNKRAKFSLFIEKPYLLLKK